MSISSVCAKILLSKMSGGNRVNFWSQYSQLGKFSHDFLSTWNPETRLVESKVYFYLITTSKLNWAKKLIKKCIWYEMSFINFVLLIDVKTLKRECPRKHSPSGVQNRFNNMTFSSGTLCAWRIFIAFITVLPVPEKETSKH